MFIFLIQLQNLVFNQFFKDKNLLTDTHEKVKKKNEKSSKEDCPTCSSGCSCGNC